MRPTTARTTFVFLVWAAALLFSACATLNPPAPPVQVPVTPEEPEPDEQPTRPDDVLEPVTPPDIAEENLGTPPPETAPPPPRITLVEARERQRSPKSKAALALVEEANIDLMRGQIDSAVRKLEKAVGLAPSSGYAYYYLGLVRFKQGNENQALVFLGQSYVKLQREDRYFAAKALALRGEVYYHIGKLNEARNDCGAALRLDPESEDAAALKKKLR